LRTGQACTQSRKMGSYKQKKKNDECKHTVYIRSLRAAIVSTMPSTAIAHSDTVYGHCSQQCRVKCNAIRKKIMKNLEFKDFRVL
jgi:hypothetical protein